MKKRERADRAEEVRDALSLLAVIDETQSLFHRLKRAAEELHRDDGLTAGQRAVLKSLQNGGPQTVPELARARPVSRQHIQSLVNPMVRAGWVKLEENPDTRVPSLSPCHRLARSCWPRWMPGRPSSSRRSSGASTSSR